MAVCTEAYPTCPHPSETFRCSQHNGSIARGVVDTITSRPGKEAYTTVQRVQGVCCQAIWSTSNSHVARISHRGQSQLPVHRCTLTLTLKPSRAVHLELTRTQSADGFQRKLNAFITRQTRPQVIISDNAATFKVTATWIQKIRKSERLQDFFARQEIKWQFNLCKSPWWGGMYEQLITEVKKTLYKTLGTMHLTFEQLEAVVIDIEKHLNNRPWTYVKSNEEEPETLTPNMIM